ncbi:MAG: glycosyltransferase family 4 protein [Anaerolineae bacterium]
MSNLRIGFITCDLSTRHGWAQYSLNLVRALRAAGVNMTVVAARNSPLVEGVEVHPILPTLAPRPRALPLRLLLKTVQAHLLLADCDIIHCTVETYAPLAAAIAGKRPLFITGHGSYVNLPRISRWPLNELYRRAFRRSTMICVSRYTAKIAQQVTPGLQTVVVNNGVEAERFKLVARINSPSLSMGRGSGGGVIFSVGAVKRRKGTLELVRAMPIVRQEFPAVQCIIAGSLTAEPGYAQQVQSAVSDLQLDGCVRLLGHVSDDELMDWYSKADVFALPSMNDGWKFEGYGLVHLEASAAGLPVIGTGDCGAEDAIDDGLTGLLVPQAEIAEKLPQAIIGLLHAPQLAAQMGAAGREKALKQTWQQVAEQVLDVYGNS